jgi:3-mercaptopyruvate sulfurtransferase SseA
VVDALRKRGFKNTAVLDEGILFWRQQGFPLEGEAVTQGSAPPGAGPPPR